MNQEFNQLFSEEVNRYKNALLFCAKQCEWETFKINAGRLFDYVESIEMSELERKFFNISKIVVFILCIVVLFIFKMNLIIISPKIARLRELITFVAVGIGCFEMYFFLNFRMYMKTKKSFYKKRRERFISNIEKDFKDIITQ